MADEETSMDNFPSYQVVMESEGMRAAVFTVEEAERIPWHRHSRIEDHFYCLLGPMIIELREPEHVLELATGESYVVRASRPHYVHGKNNGPCRFLLLQGVGEYDNELLS